ncbi:MAG: hypothetical protein A2854_01340 [Parcubacteria group bacterium RIFCSPHIGHO2_01_FULL_56_18]|nr:MAG: hypothetical protein A2854_01340 [Parcubacteria group bacterium RIFCSPHIGHO2_01_FULL_56_18]
MALTKCPECGNEISERAITCPRCGFHVSRKREIRILFISLGLMLAFFVVLFTWLYFRLAPIVS